MRKRLETPTRGTYVRILSQVSLWCLSAAPLLDARTWTDNKGRTIEADLVRVEEGTAVVNRSGKEVRLPLDILSEDDREFVEDWSAKQDPATPAVTAAPSAAVTLDGKPIEKGGRMNVMEKPFSPEVAKALAKDKNTQETTLKLAVAVPNNFDPALPQKYFVVITAVNNDAERAGGNIAKFGMYSKTCMDEGWACIAIDSNTGVSQSNHTAIEGLALLRKEWPGFSSSVFATGGFSGGAKGCWGMAARLVKENLQLTGVFMGGCNDDWSERSRKEVSASSSAFRRIRGYVSMGKADTIATIAQSEGVMKSLKSNGIRNLKSGVHDGGHSFCQPHFIEALKWFSERSVK